MNSTGTSSTSNLTLSKNQSQTPYTTRLSILQPPSLDSTSAKITIESTETDSSSPSTFIRKTSVNFTLSGINVQRDDVDNEAGNAQLDYPVEAYICLDDNSEVESPATLTQGSVLQVCVKIDDTVVAEDIIVEDILTFVVSQPDSEAIDYEPITAAATDPLTDTVCHESGICNGSQDSAHVQILRRR
jgi:hypothetical protein